MKIVACALLLPAAIASATTLYVANDGVDTLACGAKVQPCRSVSRALALASDGDKILVGPGGYGDLDGDGTLGEAGEESGFACDCLINVNRDVAVESTHGAASTVLDARTATVDEVVRMTANGAVLGKPNKGFTILSEGDGVVVAASDGGVVGNVIERFGGFGGLGIAVPGASTAATVSGNLVAGWDRGIRVDGTNARISKNVAMRNGRGISVLGASDATGNLVVRNTQGIEFGGAARLIGNAAHENLSGLSTTQGLLLFLGRIEKNNIFGNRNCGLSNTGVAGLVAANNFWGDAAGPGPNPADTVCNDVGASTLTAPVALKAFGVRPAIEP